MSELFIGTKIIEAQPMTRLEYSDYRGWKLPDDENGDDEGYLVEYSDGGRSNHPDHAGYISWTPKDVFERSYRDANEGMGFGHALHFLKLECRVRRKGWNGKGLWLQLRTPDDLDSMTLPYIFICYPDDAQNTPGARVPWQASQTDMLAEDWILLEKSQW